MTGPYVLACVALVCTTALVAIWLRTRPDLAFTTRAKALMAKMDKRIAAVEQDVAHLKNRETIGSVGSHPAVGRGMGIPRRQRRQ